VSSSLGTVAVNQGPAGGSRRAANDQRSSWERSDGAGGADAAGPVAAAGGRTGSVGRPWQTSLKSRLSLVAALLAALWALSLVVAVIGLGTAKDKATTASGTFDLLRVESNAYQGWLTDDDQSNMYSALAVLHSGTDDQLMGATWQQVLGGYQAAQQGLSQLATSDDATIRAEAQTATTDLASYNTFTQEVRADVLAGEASKAVSVMTVGNSDVSNQLQDDFNALNKSLADSSNQIRAQVGSSVANSLLVLFLISGAGILVAVGVFVRLARSILRPVADLEHTLRAVARGDLTVRSQVTADDEIGRVAAGLNDAIATQRASVTALAESAQTLGSAAEELSATGIELTSHADGTSSQAHLVSQAAATVSENVSTVAGAAEGLSASFAEISSSASEASSVATSAASLGKATQDMIVKLGDSSRQIGDVIKVIDDVADRTNVLALNAMIEAVRAGEAGKGFGVVANEVKELATETARATQDIAATVEAIQTDVRNATSAVEEITQIIGRVEDLQGRIAVAVEQQRMTTGDIARNVNQAARGSSEISDTVGTVAETASATSLGAADMQRAAEELARLAAELQARVDHFQY
jgi:methyl-accepting chemotaxis protein